jgi:hypothetical protein
MSMLSHRPKTHATDVLRSRRGVSGMTALLLLGPLSVLVAGLGISSAGAVSAKTAPNSTSHLRATAATVSARPETSRFCTLAENASKSSTASAATETPATLIQSFNKLKSEEPAILNASPSQIRGDFQTLFNFFNKFYGELASVKYSFLKLPRSYLASLALSAKPVEAASKAIQTYLTKTCGIKKTT